MNEISATDGPQGLVAREGRAVGVSVIRADAAAKATGTANYIADLHFAGALDIKLVRSTEAHAVIESIDSARALRVPGVKKVIIGSQLPYLFGDCIVDHPPLARGKTRYAGEPVAAVVASSEEAAQRAADLVTARYSQLPFVLDPVEASSPGAVLVHDHVESYRHLPSFHPQPGTNIYHHYRMRQGDAAKAMAAADVVLAAEYHFPLSAHAMLEPHGCIGHWSRDGQLTIWSSTQSPHLVKTMLAHVLGLPQHKVRVIVPCIGGGFGGKSDYCLEPLVAAIARECTGRHVRLVLEREEMFIGTVLGRGFKMTMKMGVSAAGKILAQQSALYLMGGAYGNNSVNIVEGAGHNATGPYYVPNVHVDAYGVYTNSPPVGAFRGYGHPEVHWMVERHIDQIAERLRLDPVELRLKNILRPGDTTAFGQTIEIHHGDLERCILSVRQELQEKASTAPVAPHLRRGLGLAALMKSPVMSTTAASMAFIRANPDATFHVSVSGVDIGQGSSTALAQIAAEALQVPVTRVKVSQIIDTDLSPYEWQTVASSTTWKVGNAILKAASEVIAKIKRNAALTLGCDSSELSYHNGICFVTERPDRKVALEDVIFCSVAANGAAAGEPAVGTGAYLPRGLTYADPETGHGTLAAEWTFGCQGAEVEVNMLTGEVRVVHLVTVLDAGQIINPMLAHGQLLGAMVQGMGGALMEQVVFDERGRIRNASFVDYKIPNLEDVPERMTVIFIDTPAEDTPYGARPIAEHGIVAVAPAIGNAVYHAAQLSFFNLPMTQDQVLALMKSQGGTR